MRWRDLVAEVEAQAAAFGCNVDDFEVVADDSAMVTVSAGEQTVGVPVDLDGYVSLDVLDSWDAAAS